MIYILTWIPLVFITMVSIGILTLQWGFRVLKVTELSERQDFPAAHDLPWIMMLITSGVCWIYAHSVEPRISEQIRHAEKAGALGTDSHCGMEIVVLSSAYLFLICGYELTSRLQQSICIRLFYASTLVVAGIGVFIGVSILPAWLPGHTFSGQHDVSAQPEWLTWILGVILVLIVVRQTWLIRKKFRAGDYALSLWKFKGKDLVWFGLMLGLILGCAGMILMLGALNMAFISVVYIHALISWGNSITKPATNYFNPQDYGIHDHFYFWAICGLGYTSLCLALGLGAAMVLSALEFIRFNCFRFYKAWRANQAAPPTLALQD